VLRRVAAGEGREEHGTGGDRGGQVMDRVNYHFPTIRWDKDDEIPVNRIRVLDFYDPEELERSYGLRVIDFNAPQVRTRCFVWMREVSPLGFCRSDRLVDMRVVPEAYGWVR
jgi:hypothetical protein